MKFSVFLLLAIGLLHAQGPAPASATLPADTVVAKIDGKDITAGDIRKIVANTPGLAGPYQQNPSIALADFYLTQFLAEEGEKQKLLDQSPWKEQLDALRSRLATNAMVNRERDSFPVTTEMMDEYYKANKAKYEQSKVKVIQIAFNATPPTGTSADAVKLAAQIAVENARHPDRKSEADAKAFAEDLVKKLRAGADFTEFVTKYSDDEFSKKEGGDFGFITPQSTFPDAFKKTVLGLKKGEISDPVRQPTGFYIIKVDDKASVPIDQVRETMVQEIRQDHLKTYLEGLQKRFVPTVVKPEFFSQQGGAAPPPGAPAK